MFACRASLQLSGLLIQTAFAYVYADNSKQPRKGADAQVDPLPTSLHPR